MAAEAADLTPFSPNVVYEMAAPELSVIAMSLFPGDAERDAADAAAARRLAFPANRTSEPLAAVDAGELATVSRVVRAIQVRPLVARCRRADSPAAGVPQ